MPKVRVWIDATEEKKLNKLEWLDDSGDLAGVLVHGVGQGNGNAVMTEDPAPVLYYDAGCGALFNQHTCPQALAYDFSDEPWLILSHWDFDHWWAGYNQKWDDASKCEWLAPRQMVSPMHLRLGYDLDANLRLWPNPGVKHFRSSIEATTGDDTIVIERATGPANEDRNDSCLVVTIRKAQDDDDEIVVLPGDAPYDKIESLQMPEPVKCVGLVATHHGSRTNLLTLLGGPKDEVPEALSGSSPAIVYSYGGGNVYAHPSPEAVSAYATRGWQDDPGQKKKNGDHSFRYDTVANNAAKDRWIPLKYG